MNSSMNFKISVIAKRQLTVFPYAGKFSINISSVFGVKASFVSSQRFSVVGDKITSVEGTRNFFPIMSFLTVFDQAIERRGSFKSAPRTRTADFAIFFKVDQC